MVITRQQTVKFLWLVDNYSFEWLIFLAVLLYNFFLPGKIFNFLFSIIQVYLASGNWTILLLQ